jgi:hypothetical protein
LSDSPQVIFNEIHNGEDIWLQSLLNTGNHDGYETCSATLGPKLPPRGNLGGGACGQVYTLQIDGSMDGESKGHVETKQFAENDDFEISTFNFGVVAVDTNIRELLKLYFQKYFYAADH